MKILLLHLAACGALLGCGSGFSDCYLITWTNSAALMGSADLPNYAGYLRGSDVPGSALATVANGGKVQHTTTQSGGGASITVPADAIFATDATCAVPLAGWEFETYNSTTGAANIHLNIGTLTHATNATTVLCVGKASLTTWQGNVPATWDSSYSMVLHTATVAGSLDLHDSTVNAVAVTPGAFPPPPTSVDGIVDGGVSLPGDLFDGGAIVQGSDADFSIGEITISFWLKSSSGRAAMFSYGNVFVLLDTVVKFSDIAGNTANGLTASNDGNWHYAVSVFDAAKNLSIYVDGVPGTVFNDPSLTLTRTGSWSFGNLDGFLNGSFDDVRVSSTARTASILAEYNNFANPASFYTIAVGPAARLRGAANSRGSTTFR